MKHDAFANHTCTHSCKKKKKKKKGRDKLMANTCSKTHISDTTHPNRDGKTGMATKSDAMPVAAAVAAAAAAAAFVATAVGDDAAVAEFAALVAGSVLATSRDVVGPDTADPGTAGVTAEAPNNGWCDDMSR